MTWIFLESRGDANVDLEVLVAVLQDKGDPHLLNPWPRAIPSSLTKHLGGG